MNASLATVSYIGATILFVLSLGGLSSPETARRGNVYGMIGMAIAVLATVFGPRVTAGGFGWIVGTMVVGGAIGLYAARAVKMTQMPELVALMHSLVGLAACLVGFATYIDPSVQFEGAEKTIHEIEIYVGILAARSSLATKKAMTLANGVGIIDSDYRGEIKVPLINLDPERAVTFHPGDRIAQLVIQRYVEAKFIEAQTLPGSDRAERGFGSTGVAS